LVIIYKGMAKLGKYIILLFMLCSWLHTIAQKVNYSGVPQAVIDGIRNKYPGGILNKIKRKKEGFVATIYLHDKKSEATFAANGDWQETITDEEWKGLTDSARKAFRKSSYWQWQIEEIKLIETPKSENIYRFMVKDVDPFDFEYFRPYSREYTVYISESGRITKVE